jgi:hypothetical protein
MKRVPDSYRFEGEEWLPEDEETEGSYSEDHDTFSWTDLFFEDIDVNSDLY